MALEEIAAHMAAARNAQKPPEVFQDYSVHRSPFSPVRDGDTFDLSGSTLGSGLRSHPLSDLFTPISPEPSRYAPARLDTQAPSDASWGAIAAGVGGLSFLGAEAVLFSRVGVKKGLLVNGAIASILACAAPMMEVAIVEKAPFTLSSESAVERIQDLGSSFMIGNSKASFTDVTCESDSSAVAFCTAKLSIDNAVVGNAAVLVQSTGEVLVANLASGHFAIDIDGKNATGQLAELTKDKKLVQKPDASFGATMSNGVIDSISWVRVGDQILDIGPTNAVKGSDAFVSVISQPEFIAVGSLISAALTAPEFTLTTDSTPTPRPTETPTAVPTATEIPDPLAGAPEGATGFDSETKMYYKNADDGYRYFYRELDRSWARPFIENYYAYDHWDFNAIPIDVWVKLGTPGSENIIKMTHRDVRNSDDRSVTSDYMNNFLMRKFQKTDFPGLWEGLSSESGLGFQFVFNKTIMSGEFGKNDGFQVTFVSEEELKLLYEQHKAVRSNGNLGFVYLIYDGVENGRILVRVASSQPLDKLLVNIPSGGPEYELRKMIFLPLMNILMAEETDDLINVAAMRDAGIVASDSADPRVQDGKQDLQVIIVDQ